MKFWFQRICATVLILLRILGFKVPKFELEPIEKRLPEIAVAEGRIFTSRKAAESQ
jgi:hypothetical protein